MRARPRCITCSAILAKRCGHLTCPPCRDRARRQKARLRPIVHPTHIAGYVPPKGWTAYALLGHVIAYA